MLAINNYLIIGVNPANTETSVTVDTEIKITFSKHMDVASLTPANVVLKKINGAIIDYTLTYSSITMVAILKPSAYFEAGTQYQLEIVGTSAGIKSITGDYMVASREYEFTTAYGVALSAPTQLNVTVDSGFPTLTWTKPVDYDISQVLTYEIQISASSDPLSAPVWPSVGDINKTNATVLNVPKRFSEGNYYAYVRTLDGDDTSDWTFRQFVVEAPATSPSPTPPSDGGSTPIDIFSFDVIDTYPRRDDADIAPEQVLIVFGGNVDATTVTADSVYIIKRPDKETLSLIDFMTNYSPSKAVPATITVNQALVTLTATFENDAEYTVIVRESVKNDTGTSLGIAYHWSFVSKYSQLFGSENLVRQDIGSFSDSLTDKILYNYLKDSTDYAYQIASNSSAFVASNYTDGAAPYEVHQYVRYRTAYALLLNSQLHTTGGNGSAFTKEVKLGDLTVQQEQSSAGSISISSVMSDLQDKMKLYLDMIQGHHNRGYAKPSVVVRGENIEAYPTFMTRTEFTDLGQ